MTARYIDLWQFLQYHWNWAVLLIATAILGAAMKLLAD